MNSAKELEKNKFKIISNPYKRKIIYENWGANEGDWLSLAETSDFRKPVFTDAALYHKAYDIIKTAKDSYAGNVGLEIYFEGTPDEFNALTDINENYFSESEIDIIKGERYLLPVKEVKRDIDHIFRDMIDMLSKTQSNPATDQIKKYEDVMSDTIPICVMGLYSTGKSAFINSLLGVEILPSADDPTTAKTFKISIGPKYTNYSVKFYYQDDHTEKTAVKMRFKGDRFSFNCNRNIGITSEINKIIHEKDKEGKIYSPYDRMYYALSIINSYDREYVKTRKPGSKPWRVSPLIEVTMPLDKKYTVLPVEKYDFVIYDTPGSDANKDDDIKVLKESMTGQTNGLPIYVVTSDQMSKKTHSELIKILKELGDALDRNNLMIVVNKADIPDITELSRIKEHFDDYSVSELNPAGTFFVSSIMGLGSKLLMTNRTDYAEIRDRFTREVRKIRIPKFINKQYSKDFSDHNYHFIFFDDSSSLFLHNIIPLPEYEEYKRKIKNQINEEDANECIFYNSGLHAVGSFISDFAESYSLYNKCRNAGEYLSKALEFLTDEIENKKAEQAKLSKKFEAEMNDEQLKLMYDMKLAVKEQKKESDKSLVESLNKKYNSNKVNLEKNINQKVEEILSDLRFLEFNKKDKFTNKMKAFLEQELTTQFWNFKEIAENKWPDVQANMKDAIIKIVVSSPVLTQEQKEIIQSQIETIKVIPIFLWIINIRSKDIVSGIIWLKIKEEELKRQCLEFFSIESIRTSAKFKTDWSTNIEILGEELLNKAKKCISEHNPKMKELQSRIDRCSSEMKSLDSQKEIINYKIDEISRLTEFRAAENGGD